MTYTIIFPPADREWLTQTYLKPRLAWSRWKTGTTSRDERLAAPFDAKIRTERYRKKPTNSLELYKQYPHWADRLQAMYLEAEDPSPVSGLGKWAERRRGPRHTYWVTVVAFGLAIFFGITSTVVGAMQLWVAYCQWQVSGDRFGCGPR